jgi:dCTP deaminase
MSILTQVHIKKRLQTRTWHKRLVITPLLDPNQIGSSSIDLRLGHEFIVTRRANLPFVNPTAKEYFETDRRRSEDRISLGRGRPFYLHPGELVLGSTLEYLLLPPDLAGYVTTRSSWGRVGLVIATAIAVSPGFRGVITFELTNLGYAPLKLYPGLRIAQIVLHVGNGTSPYTGRYKFPTGPEYGKIHLDSDVDFWSEKI